LLNELSQQPTDASLALSKYIYISIAKIYS